MTESEGNEANHPNLEILIADDHWVVRESLKQVTRSLDERFILEEASNFEEALETLERRPTIGLMLVDLVMPGFREFDGLQLLRKRYPSVPVVIVSIHEDPNYVLEAIRHGVIGYIPKSATAEEIRRALTRVLAGEVAFPRDIILRGTNETPRQSSDANEHDARSLSSRISQLTRREAEVMLRLGRGIAIIGIADELQISRQTVRVHLGNAMKKLNISTRESAIHFSVENAKDLELLVAELK